MGAKPSRQRRRSKDLPPDLSLLNYNTLYLKELSNNKTLYINEINSREERMRQIVRELKEIAAEDEKMQRDTKIAATTGAVAAGVGWGVAIVAAPFTAGLSLVGAAAAAAVAAGTVTVAATGLSKAIIEHKSVNQATMLVKEFMEIIEPLKVRLQKIQTLLEKTSPANQTETNRIKTILDKISALYGRPVFDIIVLTEEISDLMKLTASNFRVYSSVYQYR